MNPELLAKIREKDRAAREALKQVCAFCGKTIREGREPVSHGLCYPVCDAGKRYGWGPDAA